MPMPEMGLHDEPSNAAMYPQADAINNPSKTVTSVMAGTSQMSGASIWLEEANHANNAAVRTVKTAIVPATQAIGISLSWCGTSPSLRARDAFQARRTLSTIGFTRVITVQSPPLAMMPAPISLTFSDQTASAAATRSPGSGLYCHQNRNGNAPRDEQAENEGEAHADPHQISGADQGERKASAHLEDGMAIGKRTCELIGQKLEPGRQETQRCCGGCAEAQFAKTAFITASSGLSFIPVPGTKHFGCGDALGKRQIASHDHHPAKRNRIGNAEDASNKAHRHRLPKREVVPEADQEEAGQHENHVAQRAGRRGLRLDDVVFEDASRAHRPQNAKRYDCGGNGG